MITEKELKDLLIEKQRLQIEDYDSYDRSIEIRFILELLELIKQKRRELVK